GGGRRVGGKKRGLQGVGGIGGERGGGGKPKGGGNEGDDRCPHGDFSRDNVECCLEAAPAAGYETYRRRRRLCPSGSRRNRSGVKVFLGRKRKCDFAPRPRMVSTRGHFRRSLQHASSF